MNNTYSFYNLYCVNMQCKQSLYQNIWQTKIPLNEENLLETHHCLACEQPLTSTIEMEIKLIAAGAGVKLAEKPILWR